MKKILLILTVLIVPLLFLCCGSANEHGIKDVSFSSIKDVLLFEKIELSFQMKHFKNPYDPEIINSYCEFWSPSGEYYKVFAFFNEEFTKTDSIHSPFPIEVLTPTGKSNWMVRFTPNEVGEWQYKLTAIDSIGNTSSYPKKGKSLFKCVPSSLQGFIVKANNRYLKRTSGEFFFPVGENVAHVNQSSYGYVGTNELKHYIDGLAGKSNFIRLWISSFDNMCLIGPDGSVKTFHADLYNQRVSWQLDWIFDYAYSKNINILLAIWGHAEFGDIDYCSNKFSEKNPFNINQGGTITTPYQFFSDSASISKAKILTRYIVSRWGYATNLMAWEFWNEVNQIRYFNSTLTPPETYYADIINWHKIMYDYIKDIDPIKHLITTSYAGDIDEENRRFFFKWLNKIKPGIKEKEDVSVVPVFEIMDLVQTHDYEGPNFLSDDFQYHFYLLGKKTKETLNKPFSCGEWGPSGRQTINDPHGIELHNLLWSSSFSGAFGAASLWNWYYIDSQNLYSIFKPVNLFMNSLPVLSDDFNSYAILNTNGMRTYYLRTTQSDTIYGWVQDVNFQMSNLKLSDKGRNYIQTLNASFKPEPSLINNNINIPINQSNKKFKVEWYDAQTGDLHDSSSVVSGSMNLTIRMPSKLRESTFGDASFKIFME